MSGRRGSNPPPEAWKASALPNELLPREGVGLGVEVVWVWCGCGVSVGLGFVGRGGIEPPKATPTDLQSAPFDRSGISPNRVWVWVWWKCGCGVGVGVGVGVVHKFLSTDFQRTNKHYNFFKLLQPF